MTNQNYWENITDINARQEAKGKSKYGETLEENVTLTAKQRIEHAQEEAIDFLKYAEHLKMVLDDNYTFNDYQRAAMRTSGEYESQLDMLRNACYGLNGEAGEVIDLLKKHEFQGHELNREKMAEEIGDVLWYCQLGAYALGIPFEAIAKGNVHKLMERYPDGFDKNRSVNRREG